MPEFTLAQILAAAKAEAPARTTIPFASPADLQGKPFRITDIVAGRGYKGRGKPGDSVTFTVTCKDDSTWVLDLSATPERKALLAARDMLVAAKGWLVTAKSDLPNGRYTWTIVEA